MANHWPSRNSWRPKGQRLHGLWTVACAQDPCEGCGARSESGQGPFDDASLSGGTDLVVARINGSDGTIGKNSTNEDWADQVGGVNDEDCGR